MGREIPHSAFSRPALGVELIAEHDNESGDEAHVDTTSVLLGRITDLRNRIKSARGVPSLTRAVIRNRCAYSQACVSPPLMGPRSYLNLRGFLTITYF